jgi:hypothetical protein
MQVAVDIYEEPGADGKQPVKFPHNIYMAYEGEWVYKINGNRAKQNLILIASDLCYI